MKVGKRYKVNYYGEEIEANYLKPEHLKEPAFFADSGEIILFEELDEEPVEIEDHRPKDPPGTK